MYTERCFVINLDVRKDRLQQFYDRLPKNFPWGIPERWQAIHGDSVKHPDWWTAGNGAWGCYKSHLNILEYCLNNNVESYTVFEDDAFFRDDFNNLMLQFYESLPEWEMVYLGGQLLHTEDHPPVCVNSFVYTPFNVNRTHAFMLRGRKAMTTVYKFLQAVPFETHYHIDHHLGLLHERKKLKLFCPNKWLVGQCESTSNISGKQSGLTFFDDPYKYALATKDPFAGIGPAKL
jgi:GR25 family glycosyltransferase involved in LPS biosynthesis